MADLLQGARLGIGEGARIVSAEERDRLMGQGTVLPPSTRDFINSGGRPVVANKWKQTSARKLLNEEDPIAVPRQKWAVVSVIIPGDTTTEQAKADKICIKVAGCFDDGPAADRFMEELYAKRPYLDLHAIRTGVLVPFPADDETRRHVKHYSQDPKAQEVLDRYFNREFAARERQLERLDRVRQDAAEGRPGEGHVDLPDLDPAEITFQAAKDVGKGPAVLDPESDEPRLLHE